MATKGRDEGGHAGAEAGGARASAAVVDDRRNLGEEPLVRDAAGNEHVLGRPRRNLGRVGLGGVELVEAETEELTAARSLEDDAALADGMQRAHLWLPNGGLRVRGLGVCVWVKWGQGFQVRRSARTASSVMYWPLLCAIDPQPM